MVAITLVTLLLSQAAAPSFDPFAGDYQLATGESDDIAKAVDRAVEKMSVLTRGTARSRVAAKCIAYPAVHITKEGTGFRINLEKGSNVVVAPGGPAATWKTPEGESVQIRLENDFRHVIDSKDGQRINHFSLTGNRLVIQAKLSSSRLPAPVEYKLVYTRK